MNEQSKRKIELKADKIRPSQWETILPAFFDRETLEDDTVYFFNTQKLAQGNDLVIHSERRVFTIWETLENTAREKGDRFYLIIDEAHRGMQG